MVVSFLKLKSLGVTPMKKLRFSTIGWAGKGIYARSQRKQTFLGEGDNKVVKATTIEEEKRVCSEENNCRG